MREHHVARLNRVKVPSVRLGMGAIGLSLMLVADFGLVFWLRGISICRIAGK